MVNSPVTSFYPQHASGLVSMPLLHTGTGAGQAPATHHSAAGLLSSGQGLGNAIVITHKCWGFPPKERGMVGELEPRCSGKGGVSNNALTSPLGQTRSRCSPSIALGPEQRGKREQMAPRSGPHRISSGRDGEARTCPQPWATWNEQAATH